MNCNNKFEQYFIGNSSLSKTLRNELRPVGKTFETMTKYGIVTEDEKRAEKYQEAKKIIDDFHRYFIEKSLTRTDINWNEIFVLTKKVRESQDEKLVKELEKQQEKARKSIVKCFKNQDEFELLFKKELITELLPKYIENNKDYSADMKKDYLEVLQWFNMFSSYFTGFHKNRANMYSDGKESTAVSFRIVHENGEIFYYNLETFNRVKKNIPDEIFANSLQLKEMLDDWSLEQIFSADFYNLLTNQRAMTHFNDICGVMNGIINEYCQKNKLDRRHYLMKSLHKQILSLEESSFELPEKFECDSEVICAVNAFLTTVQDNDIRNRVIALMDNHAGYDYERIYICAKSFTDYSQKIAGNWSFLNRCIHNHYMENVSGKEDAKKDKVDKIVKKIKVLSFKEIHQYISEYKTKFEKDFEIGQIEEGLYFKIISDYTKEIEIEKIEKNNSIKITEDESIIEKIKRELDFFQELLHLLRPFVVEENLQKDIIFYPELEQIIYELEPVIALYNKVRNYVTQKPYSTEKVKLNFGIPTLADGWDKNKEYQNNAILFIKDNKIYLGILNAKNKPKKEQLTGKKDKISDNDYQKVVYKLLPGPNKMLPKVFFSKKNIEQYAPSNEIIEGYERGIFKKGDDFDIDFCHNLIDFYKDSISKHPDWKEFGFVFKDTESYGDISEFYREISEQGYKISFEYFSEAEIDKMVNEEKLYLFQIYNKDFADGKKENSKENLHTMYLKNLFSKENLENGILKLNGEAELFYRKASITNPYVHKTGDKMLNKQYQAYDSQGNEINLPVPESVYMELFQYFNGAIEKLSEEAEEYKDKVIVKEVGHDIIKDRRYSCDKFLFHMPITINYRVLGNSNINEITQKYIAENLNDINVIGIDRGERNLLYVSVINPKGRLLYQKSYNVINGYNYQAKLAEKEKIRNDSRRNWKSIGTIKELKEGYLSQVIHEIIHLMMEYNAVIVMENLNSGFKNSRKKVERQVYQKFETMLIDKLNYIVFKERDVCSPGGVLKGYQMTYRPDKLSAIGKQCGMIFYVPAAYTSKIDPTTGFVDIFDYKNYETSVVGKKRFLTKFESIKYDKMLDMFGFSFDYLNFRQGNSLAVQKWTAYTNGKRIIHKGDHHEICTDVSPTEMIKNAFETVGINCIDGHELLDEIKALDERKDKELINNIFYAFKITMQMRNYKSNSVDIDYIISPVKNGDGRFFMSNDNICEANMLPENADANGAYHIALKGLYLINQIYEKYIPGKRIDMGKIDMSNKTWFDYVQNRRFEEK